MSHCRLEMFARSLWVLKVIIGWGYAVEAVDELCADAEALIVAYYPGYDSAYDEFETSNYT